MASQHHGHHAKERGNARAEAGADGMHRDNCHKNNTNHAEKEINSSFFVSVATVFVSAAIVFVSAATVFVSAAFVFLISCHRLLASSYCFRASTAIGGIRAKGLPDGHRAHRAKAAHIFDSDGIEVNFVV